MAAPQQRACSSVSSLPLTPGFELSSPPLPQAAGLDRLKSELQRRGLKAGGTLAQRAERLFLLKAMPLDQLDRKHLAKP